MAPAARDCNGYLLADKPVGMSSRTLTHAVRRAIGAPGGRRGLKVGHAGTLDPFATGLVIVLLGRATRLMPHVIGCDKRYELTARLGCSSTTDDLDGDVTMHGVGDVPPTAAAIEAAVAKVAARTMQVPPAVSALHIDGVRAYQRVRRGETVTVEARPVVIHEAVVTRIGDVIEHDGTSVIDVDIDVRCGTGTYLRAFARDVGELLGTHAMATALRRTEVGEFSVADAVTPNDARMANVRPMRELVSGLASIDVTPEQAVDVAHGRTVSVDATLLPDNVTTVALCRDGDLIAIAHPEPSTAGDHGAAASASGSILVLRPETVLVRPDELPNPIGVS